MTTKSNSTPNTSNTSPKAPPAAGKSIGPKVTVTGDYSELTTNSFAKLTFTFSTPPHGFTLDDVRVTNGALTSLVRDANNPAVYTAMFLGGVTDRSGMSTIHVQGPYTDSQGATGTPSNTLTIKNVDRAVVPTVAFSTNNMTVVEGNSGSKIVTATISLSQAVAGEVSVAYSTDKKTFGTAKVGEDYRAANGMVVFAPGETTKTISLEIMGDSLYETNEYFYLDLLSAQGATVVTNGAEGAKSSYMMVNIKNDDVNSKPTVGFATNNMTVVEGHEGTRQVQVTVSLSAAATEAVTVDYSTEIKTFGTAKANADYVPVKGSLVFAPGEISKTITMSIVGDTVYEANEYFYLDLIAAKGADIVTNGAEGAKSAYMMVNIKNDDASSKPTVSFASNHTSVVEGNYGIKTVDLTVKLSGAAAEAVSVDYSTEQKTFGTAKANLDYVTTKGTLVFAAGETSKTISVQVVSDTAYEADEYFYLDLVSAKGAAIVTNGAEGANSSYTMINVRNDDLATSKNQVSGVYGTSGADKLGGTALDDLIDGRGGADIITGFAGNDTFAFAAAYATRDAALAARVLDFKDGVDQLGLRGALKYADLVVTDASNGEGAILALGSGETLAVLVGVKATAVDAGDFLLLAM